MMAREIKRLETEKEAHIAKCIAKGIEIPRDEIPTYDGAYIPPGNLRDGEHKIFNYYLDFVNKELQTDKIKVLSVESEDEWVNDFVKSYWQMKDNKKAAKKIEKEKPDEKWEKKADVFKNDKLG